MAQQLRIHVWQNCIPCYLQSSPALLRCTCHIFPTYNTSAFLLCLWFCLSSSYVQISLACTLHVWVYAVSYLGRWEATCMCRRRNRTIYTYATANISPAGFIRDQKKSSFSGLWWSRQAIRRHCIRIYRFRQARFYWNDQRRSPSKKKTEPSLSHIFKGLLESCIVLTRQGTSLWKKTQHKMARPSGIFFSSRPCAHQVNRL